MLGLCGICHQVPALLSSFYTKKKKSCNLIFGNFKHVYSVSWLCPPLDSFTPSRYLHLSSHFHLHSCPLLSIFCGPLSLMWAACWNTLACSCAGLMQKMWRVHECSGCIMPRRHHLMDSWLSSSFHGLSAPSTMLPEPCGGWYGCLTRAESSTVAYSQHIGQFWVCINCCSLQKESCLAKVENSTSLWIERHNYKKVW